MASDRLTLEDVHAGLVGLYRVFEGRALAGDIEAGSLCCSLLGTLADVLESIRERDEAIERRRRRPHTIEGAVD